MIYRDEFVTISTTKKMVLALWHKGFIKTIVFHGDHADTEELEFAVANPDPANPRRLPMHVGYN